MQVVGGNRNAKNCPIGPDGKRDWSFGLFGCFGRCDLCTLDPDQTATIFPPADHPLGVGCWAWCCPCVVYSKSKQRLHSLQTQGTPLPNGGETFDSNCCIYGWLAINGDTWIMQVCWNINKMHMRIWFLTMIQYCPPGRYSASYSRGNSQPLWRSWKRV